MKKYLIFEKKQNYLFYKNVDFNQSISDLIDFARKDKQNKKIC